MRSPLMNRLGPPRRRRTGAVPPAIPIPAAPRSPDRSTVASCSPSSRPGQQALLRRSRSALRGRCPPGARSPRRSRSPRVLLVSHLPSPPALWDPTSRVLRGRFRSTVAAPVSPVDREGPRRRPARRPPLGPVSRRGRPPPQPVVGRARSPRRPRLRRILRRSGPLAPPPRRPRAAHPQRGHRPHRLRRRGHPRTRARRHRHRRVDLPGGARRPRRHLPCPQGLPHLPPRWRCCVRLG